MREYLLHRDKMIAKAKQFFQAKDLIWAWTGRTIRGRYQQSLLGWFWAVVQPVATVAIFTIVFTRFVKVDTGDVPYVLFSYVAVVPWTFFASSLTDMAMSLVQNMNLVTKIYFPREALPIAAMLARLLDFGISAVIIVLLIIIYGRPITPISLLFLPIILLVQVALTLGLGLIAAAGNVFYRDVDPLLRLTLQIWFYASPIIYPASLVPPNLQDLYYLNPMVGIIEAYRDVMVYGKMPGTYFFPAVIISTLVLALGYLLFKRVEPLFADIV